MEILFTWLLTFLIGLLCVNVPPKRERRFADDLIMASMEADRVATMCRMAREDSALERQLREERQRREDQHRNDDLRWELLLMVLTNEARASAKALPVDEQLSYLPGWTEHLVECAYDKRQGWPLGLGPFSFTDWVALHRNSYTRGLLRPFEGPFGFFGVVGHSTVPEMRQQ